MYRFECISKQLQLFEIDIREFKVAIFFMVLYFCDGKETNSAGYSTTVVGKKEIF